MLSTLGTKRDTERKSGEEERKKEEERKRKTGKERNKRLGTYGTLRQCFFFFMLSFL